MHTSVENFKKRIEESTKKKLQLVVCEPRNEASGQDSENNTRRPVPTEGPRQHIWVEHMEKFRHALMDIHRSFIDNNMVFELPRMKYCNFRVALIDDGVNMTKLDQYKLNGKELVDITGANYCDRPWYESTDDEHGTLMANMILRINPWAKLYVMKLKSYQSNNRRTIYPESAANAILGAIEEDVDIISMSWSIKAMASNQDNKEGTTEPIAIGRLRGAIDEAKKNKIIMFCSASDNIGTASKANLPFTQAPNYIFRIGAADHLGQPDAASEDTSAINYYFPGNKVADSWNPRSLKTVEYHDGSSIATALAAGLASLIMYCVLIVERYRTNYLKDEKKWPSIRKAIRIRDNLKRALDNIDSSSWGGDKRYLPVWDIFGKATTRINEAKSIEDMLYELEVFVTKLCHKVE